MVHRNLSDILKRARAELRINPTIEVYTFDNGVEQRRPANMWAKFNAAAREATASMTELGEAFRNVGEAARKMKLQELEAWVDDERRRRKF